MILTWESYKVFETVDALNLRSFIISMIPSGNDKQIGVMVVDSKGEGFGPMDPAALVAWYEGFCHHEKIRNSIGNDEEEEK